MKTFLGRVLAVVIGIGIFMFLCFMFFSLIIAAFGQEKEVDIDKNSVLLIEMDQPMIENLTEQRNSIFEIGNTENPTLLNLLNAIEKAKDDDNIKGISLELDISIPDEISQITLLREEIKKFKESGKFVYAYTNRIQQSDYYLSTVADSIFHNPMGTIELKGLASEITFYKNMGEKYGVEFEVIRHGKYKAAVEPFIRENLSNENREQLTEIISDIWTNLATEMSISRSMSLQELNSNTDSLSAFLAQSALQNKLVDVLAHESEYHDFLKRKLSIELDEDLKTISLNDYAKTLDKKITGEKIAVLYAQGMILPGDSQYGIQSEVYKDVIRDLAEDDDIKAVVLRVNSGGGDANTSDELLFELKKLHEKKPIVVSFGEVAASGGYYIAQASDRIYAEPTTITGSIGVLGMIPNAKGLLNNIGITHDYVTSNANSLFYSPFQGLSPDAMTTLTKSTESVYETFITHVANNRNMTVAQVDSLGGGRVYTAPKALQLGLVDEIGSLKDAIAYAAEKADIDDYRIKSLPVKEDELEVLLKELNVSAQVKKEILNSADPAVLETYLKIEGLRKLKGAQVLWPYDFKLN
ncbi:signal peptide peptidase SppA [Flavobacteriaceae bacterium Ap0902]|nr:signal peptide peptidase SppA [Flavobacteriaceae bacterium Ap0902]